MLQRLGFQSKWIRWVKGCFKSTSASILINGSPITEFYLSRGLRQGDSLTSFLFFVVAEGLVWLVRQALEENLLKGVKVGRNELECCMLQFIDDTLFMCKDSYNNVITIKVILRCYELASGMKINFHKSKLAGINVERNSLECYVKSLNCTLTRLPFKYLRLVVGGSERKKLFWEQILNKINDRLSA